MKLKTKQKHSKFCISLYKNIGSSWAEIQLSFCRCNYKTHYFKMINKVFFKLSFFLFLCQYGEISGQCILDLPADVALSPTFYKNIGSRVTVLSNEEPFIELYENENIKAECGTQFEL